jgi:hypothetical protein
MTAQQHMTTAPSAAPGMPRNVATRRRVAAIAAALAVVLAGYGGARAVTSVSANEITIPAATAQDAAATTDHARSGPDHLVRPDVAPDHLDWPREGPDHLR